VSDETHSQCERGLADRSSSNAALPQWQPGVALIT